MADISLVQKGLYVGSASFDWDDVWREFDSVVTLISVAQWGKPPRESHRTWVVYPMEDSESMPPEDDLLGIVDFVVREVRAGKNVLVHCGAGLNRSGLVGALAILALRPDLTNDEVLELLRRQRGPLALCNPWFARYVRDFPRADQTA